MDRHGQAESFPYSRTKRVIVPHDTGRGRDLHGMLRLSRVSGDPAVVDIRYLDESYALDSPIPVVEPGHNGCGEHTWHSGVATLTVSGVVDSGGVKRVDCVANEEVPPVTPTQTWEITRPAPLLPINGSGSVATVVADQAGAYSCTFTATADRDCPPGPISVGPQTEQVVSVRVDNIDATDPHGAKVTYFVDPGGALVDSVTFSAPGASGAQSHVVGEFFFTFDQSDLVTGDNTIRLESTISGTVCTTDVIATRNWTHAPPQGTMAEIALFVILVEGAGPVTVPVLHEIWGQFNFICYSTNVLPGSKTLWFGNALVNISTQESDVIPTQIAGWIEEFILRDINGGQLQQTMLDVTYPTIPAQGPNFRRKDVSVDGFFEPDMNLMAVGDIDSLVFTDRPGGDLVFPVAVPPPMNTEVDLLLEENSNVPTDCP